MYAIGKLLLLSLVQTASQANARVDVLRISDTCTGGKTVPFWYCSAHLYSTVIAADFVKRAKDIAKKVAR